MEKNIKLIALDLDGTLLKPDKTISERDYNALKKAADQNINIVIATGRPLSGIEKILKKLKFVRYVVLSNGAVIYDVEKKENIIQKTIDSEEAIHFLDYAKKENIVVDYFYKGERIVSYDWVDYIKKAKIDEESKAGLLHRYNVVEDIRKYLTEISGVEKISMRLTDEKKVKEMILPLKEKFPEFSICSSLSTNIEATKKNVNKGTGLKSLADYLKIDMKNIMSFGDNGNDCAMLKKSGLGIAMSNASEDAKKSADYITKSNIEDGVALQIEEVFKWKQV